MLSYAANILFFSNLFYGFLKYISIGFVTRSLAKEMIAIAILLLVLTLQNPGSFAFRSSSQIKIAPKRQFCFQAFNPAEMTTTLSVNDLNALKTEAMSHFATKPAEIQFSPTSGGVNNYMDYVVLPSGQKYVLRIYNNGLNSRRVIFEHNILDALNAAGKFSFAIPKAVRSFKTGLTYVTLSNGAEATLFEFIPGELPKKKCVREIGQAAGQLVTAMARITETIGQATQFKAPNPPYFDLYRAHHALTRDIFYSELAKLRTEATAEVLVFVDLLMAEIVKIEAVISHVQTLSPPLPQQLIHGDLHYDNVLCQDGSVTGLLDFEFCAFDWRAMELAVCLSKYADKPDEALDIFRLFVEGFAEQGCLSKLEATLIPDLIILRILSNVVYFIGRSYAGEDSSASLTSRAENYYKRIEWIHNNRQEIVSLVQNKMKDN